MDENFDDINDVPLIEKSQQPIYKISKKKNILSTIFLLVNFKVFNGLSNTCLTQIPKVCNIIRHIYIKGVVLFCLSILSVIN